VRSGHPGCDMLMHYFSYSVSPGRVQEEVLGHVTPNLCFCIPCDLEVTYRILVCLGCETSMHYFSFSGGPGAGLNRSVSGHVTPNLCFYILCDLEVT
jgi:hypothetical protein